MYTVSSITDILEQILCHEDDKAVMPSPFHHDINVLCGILIEELKIKLPLRVIEYSFDLFDQVCYLYVDGQEIDVNSLCYLVEMRNDK